MRLVYILVEGATEEAFVEHVLAPNLPSLFLKQIIVKTSREGARAHKGGTVIYAEFEKQIRILLKDPNAILVTTMMDFQGLHSSFPGRGKHNDLPPVEQVLATETEMAAKIPDARYKPFLFSQEFEAMLFVAPQNIAQAVGVHRLDQEMRNVLRRYNHLPETINDSPATSPSARIEKLCEEFGGSRLRYQKREHGLQAVQQTGVETIRQLCPHFGQWLSMLERLAD